MFRKFLWGAAAAGVAVLTALPVAAQAAEAPIRIRLGYQSLWANGGEIFEVLRHTNILELNGLSAEFKTFTYGGPLGEAAVAGEIDNVFAADAPTLRAAARIPGTKILSRTHDQRFAILVRPDFQGGLADLRGKRLSGPFGTTVFPRSLQAIIAAGIADPFKEMTVINQDIAEQATSLQSGQIDAVTTWDPAFEQILQQKIGKILWQAPLGQGMGVQALSGKWLAHYGDDGAVRLLKSWIIATWWASQHIDQAHAWFVKTSRLSPQILQAAASVDRYLRQPVADPKSIDFTISDAEIRDTQAVVDFLHDRKLLTARIEAAPFYDAAPEKRAQAEIAAGNYPDLAKIQITAP